MPFRIWTDNDAITSWLNAEIAAGVLDAVEAQAISGDGTGENCTGVLHVSGTTAVAFDTDVITTLRSAVTAMQNLGDVPTGWALSAADAQGVGPLALVDRGRVPDGRLRKRPPRRVRNLRNMFATIPRVVSKSVPAGTAILADWAQLKLFIRVIRESMRIDLDASGTLFQHNQIQLRAESRVGVGILRPQAFAIIVSTIARNCPKQGHLTCAFSLRQRNLT